MSQEGVILPATSLLFKIHQNPTSLPTAPDCIKQAWQEVLEIPGVHLMYLKPYWVPLRGKSKRAATIEDLRNMQDSTIARLQRQLHYWGWTVRLNNRIDEWARRRDELAEVKRIVRIRKVHAPLLHSSREASLNAVIPGRRERQMNRLMQQLRAIDPVLVAFIGKLVTGKWLHLIGWWD